MRSDNTIPRERYLERIRPLYDVDIIKVIMGPRRSGKSVILSMICDEIDADDDHKIQINFEDLRFDFIKDAKDLDEYVRKQMAMDGKYYLFLDEIQYVKDFAKALASIKATTDCSIFVTGSNSRSQGGQCSSRSFHSHTPNRRNMLQ